MLLPLRRSCAANRTPGRPLCDSGWPLLSTLLALSILLLATALRAEEFETIQSILANHCISCHGVQEQFGGLRLDSAQGIATGGDSGSVVKPHAPNESLILQRILSTDPNERMPPEGKRLEPELVESIRAWIEKGGAGLDSAGNASGSEMEAAHAAAKEVQMKHWAWQPLVAPHSPLSSPEGNRSSRADDGTATNNTIDRFIEAKLAEANLPSGPLASKRIWLRRVTMDLIGLPPTPEEMAAFENDPSPDAYDRVVDRLLASPRYGERWGRHWLDIVHYGDTHGYDKDQPRNNAWPYRDYVIRSFNQDRAYGEFIRQQLAGDVTDPDTADGNEALGFIAAGPWDLIGHAEVPETKTDGKIARHLDRDNMVANTIGTFCSVTIHCAQCHNHKFDPFTQEDYYSLQAVFAAVDRADRTYYADPQVAQEIDQSKREVESLRKEHAQILASVENEAGASLSSIDMQITQEMTEAIKQLPPAYGYHSEIASKPTDSRWVQVDLGSEQGIAKIQLHPCHDDFNGIGSGFGFPVRYRIEGSNDETFTKDVVMLVDASTVSQTNPKLTPVEHSINSASVRYVRITATELAPRQNDFIFALGELELFDRDGKNLARQATVTAQDSIEAPVRWGKNNLIDGNLPTGSRGDFLKQLTQQRQELWSRWVTPAMSERMKQIDEQIGRLTKQIQSAPPPQRVYAGTVHTGTGAFRGTGANGGKPRPIFILARGNVLQPGRAAQPNAIRTLPTIPGAFELPEESPEQQRRMKLAQWISSHDNPLTWRSIANRLWQYHFGKGIVETSNDFGLMGSTPSHPELLDWLATELRDGGESLKRLQRTIVLCNTYRLASDHNDPRCNEIDANNNLLWRQNRRKLEAELVRDSVLQASGSLDLRMHGAGYRDFVVEHPEHSPHYEYDLADPNNPETFRRSIYRFIVRSQTQPFMTLLDCADPSLRVEKRNESVSATQALTLLNNGFMVTQAKKFAERLEREYPGDVKQQATRAWWLAFARAPTPQEHEALVSFVQENGWSNGCRVLINLNEFTFVD